MQCSSQWFTINCLMKCMYSCLSLSTIIIVVLQYNEYVKIMNVILNGELQTFKLVFCLIYQRGMQFVVLLSTVHQLIRKHCQEVQHLYSLLKEFKLLTLVLQFITVHNSTLKFSVYFGNHTAIHNHIILYKKIIYLDF